MKQAEQTPHNSLNDEFLRLKGEVKDKLEKSQKQIIFRFLQDNVATTRMLEQATGIPKNNITRLKRNLEFEGKIKEVYKRKCKVTGHKAWYYTANYISESVSNSKRDK